MNDRDQNGTRQVRRQPNDHPSQIFADRAALAALRADLEGMRTKLDIGLASARRLELAHHGNPAIIKITAALDHLLDLDSERRATVEALAALEARR